jgi:hypothetical protein
MEGGLNAATFPIWYGDLTLRQALLIPDQLISSDPQRCIFHPMHANSVS